VDNMFVLAANVVRALVLKAAHDFAQRNDKLSRLPSQERTTPLNSIDQVYFLR
jgi:hypothetical protein